MAARFQAVGVDEASLPGELGEENWHTGEYQDVCFLGFGFLIKVKRPWIIVVGLTDSCTCAQIIRRFEKLAESMAEAVRRSKPKKENASGPGPLVSPTVSHVCELQLGDRFFCLCPIEATVPGL